MSLELIYAFNHEAWLMAIDGRHRSNFPFLSEDTAN